MGERKSGDSTRLAIHVAKPRARFCEVADVVPASTALRHHYPWPRPCSRVKRRQVAFAFPHHGRHIAHQVHHGRWFETTVTTVDD